MAKEKKPQKPKKSQQKPVVPPPPEPPTDLLPHELEVESLTPLERQFLNRLVVHHNPTAAYREVRPQVSYQSARAGARTLLERPHVKAEYDAALVAMRCRNAATVDNVLRELQRVAFSDPLHTIDECNQPRPLHQIPYDARKAISSVTVGRRSTKVTRSGRSKTTTTYELVRYTLWSKTDALEKLCKHLGITTEITPLEALLNLLPSELARQVREAMAAGVASLPASIAVQQGTS